MKKAILLALAASLCWAGVVLASGGGGGGVHWGYSGETGPEHWGSLAPEFRLCSEGLQQSPINISEAVTVNQPELSFAYGKTSLQLLNNGHSVQVNYAAGSGIKLGSDSYQLQQFHFHSPSENQLDGVSYPMEVHMVHKNAQGQLAVVGLLFQNGEANPLLDKLFDYAPSKANSTMEVFGKSINVADLLPRSPAYYGYEGSLTTPPCSEGVRWLVLKQTVTASPEQIAKFRRYFHDQDTNRPVQPLNGRVVYK